MDGDFNKKDEIYRVIITLNDGSVVENEYIGDGKIEGPIFYKNPDPFNHPEKNMKMTQIKRVKLS